MLLDELSKQIAEWNAETFPNATIETQLMKLEEEVEEMTMAHGVNYLQELVDVFIVASALSHRFHSYLGHYVLEIIENKIKGNEKFIGYVELKMQVNKERHWKEIEQGVYHH